MWGIEWRRGEAGHDAEWTLTPPTHHLGHLNPDSIPIFPTRSNPRLQVTMSCSHCGESSANQPSPRRTTSEPPQGQEPPVESGQPTISFVDQLQPYPPPLPLPRLSSHSFIAPHTHFADAIRLFDSIFVANEAGHHGYPTPKLTIEKLERTRASVDRPSTTAVTVIANMINVAIELYRHPTLIANYFGHELRTLAVHDVMGNRILLEGELVRATAQNTRELYSQVCDVCQL